MQVENPSPKRGFLANTFFSIFAWFFPLCLAFIATPILVGRLGTEMFGIYAIFQGFLSFAFTTGIGRVAAKYIPEYRVANQSAKLEDTLSATIWLTLAIGVLQAAALVAVTKILVSDVLLISPGQRATAETSLYIAAAAGLIMMLSHVFQSALHGQHKFAAYSVFTNLSAVCLSLGNIALAVAGYGVVELAAWNLLIAAVFALCFFSAAKGSLPELKLKFDLPRDIFGSVARYAGSVVVYQGLTSVLYAFERTWIVRTAGAESLTFYVIPMMLAIYMHGLLVNLLYVLFPKANELLNDKERLAELYKRATKGAGAILFLIVTTYICTGRTFLFLWVGDEFAERSYDLLVIHSLAYGLNAICIVVWMLAETVKAPGLNVFSTALWVSAAIPLMIVFGDVAGTQGIALARLAGVVLTIPLIFYIERRVFGRVLWKFWAGIVARAGVAAFALFWIERIVLRQFGDNWPALITAGAAGTVVFALMLIISGYLTKAERESIWVMAGSRFSKKS